MELEHLKFKTRMLNFEFNEEIDEDFYEFRKILEFYSTKKKLKVDFEYQPIKSYLINKNFYNKYYSFPENLKSDKEIINYYNQLFYSTIVASLLSLDFVQNELKKSVGDFQPKLFRRLVLDFFTFYEYHFECINLFVLRESDLVINIQNINFILCSEDEISNDIPENQMIIFLCLEIRRLIEFYFLEILNDGKPLKKSNGDFFTDLKGLFESANKSKAIKVYDYKLLIRCYEFLNNAVHRNNTPYLFSIIYIYYLLLSKYFNYEHDGNRDYRGRLELIGFEINGDKLKALVANYIKEKNRNKQNKNSVQQSML